MVRALVGVVMLVLATVAPRPLTGALPTDASRSTSIDTSDEPQVETGPSAVDELEDRFLTTRPPLGPTYVVNVAGESPGRILTARTLQGVVNRTSARLYLIDGGDPGAQVLLDRYVDRGLVTVVATTGLDQALEHFAGEVAGYVLADPAEPWSVHGASVIAGLDGGLVATADQVAGLQALGLAELDDTRGRWPDAVTAYHDLAVSYGGELASDTVAVVRPSDTLWDFVVQQGILPIFTRPDDPTWPSVQPLFDAVPDGSPVYGYLSDTGEEEAIALAALAVNDLTLVPTDTTRNLSFHVAVGADQPRVPMAAPALDEVEPCSSDTVNVVVGVTDGDNMNVPLNHFLRPANWDHPRRGDLPIGWSLGPDLAVLAPAAWDTYALEATGRDELIAMIGWAYGAPALLPDATSFYEISFDLMDELGLRTFWSLGGGLDTPTSSYWDVVDAAAGTGAPYGVLVGYGNAVGSAFYSPAGRPAFTSRSVYSETPADLAAHVTHLQGLAPEDRPLVNFLSATNWSNPVGALIDVLEPFSDQGVRFLTPAEATACMPPAPEPPPPPRPEPETCLPIGPITQHGLALISDPIATEVTATPTPFAPGAEVTAPTSVESGETIDYTATITVDLAEFADETLDARVRPIVEAGYGPELAASAWVVLGFEHLTIPFPVPDGATPAGPPTVVGAVPQVSAAWTADGLAVDVAELSLDSRAPTAPLEVTVRWSVLAEDRAVAHDVVLEPGPVRFDLVFEVGVVLGTVPLTGGIVASWSCLAGAAPLAVTNVVPPSVGPTTTDPPAGPTSTDAGPADPAPDDPGSATHAIEPASVATALRSTPSFTG
jgi:hypothetical protein